MNDIPRGSPPDRKRIPTTTPNFLDAIAVLAIESASPTAPLDAPRRPPRGRPAGPRACETVEARGLHALALLALGLRTLSVPIMEWYMHLNWLAVKEFMFARSERRTSSASGAVQPKFRRQWNSQQASGKYFNDPECYSARRLDADWRANQLMVFDTGGSHFDA